MCFGRHIVATHSIPQLLSRQRMQRSGERGSKLCMYRMYGQRAHDFVPRLSKRLLRLCEFELELCGTLANACDRLGPLLLL
jgi:hypothetical protein